MFFFNYDVKHFESLNVLLKCHTTTTTTTTTTATTTTTTTTAAAAAAAATTTRGHYIWILKILQQSFIITTRTIISQRENSCTPLGDPRSVFAPLQLVLNWHISNGQIKN